MKKILFLVAAVALLASFVVLQNQQESAFQAATKPVTYAEYLAHLTEEINASGASWKATNYKRWTESSYESMKRLMGSLETPEHIKARFETVNNVAANIPATFNATVQWPGCASIPEIRDQANCGSCWSFGAAEAMTDRYCIAQNQQQNPRIAMEDILTCCATCGYGCNGGYPIMAWEYWVSTGVVTGDLNGELNWCQPYFIPSCGLNCPSTEMTAPACSTTCTPGYTGTTTYENSFYYGQSAYQVANNVAAIQTEIMTNGPVEATFQVYEDFYQYVSGVYVHKTGGYVGGHAIKILGWSTDAATNQAYWIVANSWSPAWGMNGFFWILRGVNECGIEAGVVAGLPKL